MPDSLQTTEIASRVGVDITFNQLGVSVPSAIYLRGIPRFLDSKRAWYKSVAYSVAQLRHLLSVCYTSQFNRKVKEKDANSSAFFECGYSLLWHYAADWGCEDCVLRTFLIEIESLYNDLPYHNSIHGAMVCLRYTV